MGAAALGALVAAYYASQGEEGVVEDDGLSSWERLKTRTSDAFDVSRLLLMRECS
jgi:hypothetical protein